MSEELAIIESTDNLMVIEQLPKIKQNLITLKPKIEAAVAEALALDVNEETVKTVKKVKANLNNMEKALDAERIKLKTAYMTSYDSFSQVFADCVTKLIRDADGKLKAKINEVEQKLKDKTAAKVIRYFDEYALSKNLQWLTFEQSGIKVGLSDTETGLKKQCASFVDKVADDIEMITPYENADEIMVEYKTNGLSAIKAITTVRQRNEAKELERQRIEAAAQAKAQQAQTVQKVERVIATVAPVVEVTPVVEKDPDEVLTATFTITDTRARMQALKRFLESGGYKYDG